MGYTLKNESGAEIDFNMWGWGTVRRLAEDYGGWKPLGTLPPVEPIPEPAWDGRYTSNNGQLVSPQDAEALAKALEVALAIPDLAVRVPSLANIDYRTWIGDLIIFCRKGGFRIW